MASNKKFQLTNPAAARTSELAVLSGTAGPDVLDISTLPKDQGVFTYDPGFMSTAATSERDHLHRRRRRRPAVSRLPDRAAGRAQQLPRGRRTCCRRATCRARRNSRSSTVLDLAPHDAERVAPAAVLQRLPPRRAPDGDGRPTIVASTRGLLPRLDATSHNAAPPRDLHAPHRSPKLPTDRGRGLQARARPAVHLSAQRPRLRGEHAAHVLRGALRGVPAVDSLAARRRSTCCSSCTPTTSRTRARRPCGSPAAPAATRMPRCPRASRRSGARRTAARTKRCVDMLEKIGDAATRPEFLGKVKDKQGRRAAHGLRPPRVQELRPARDDHPRDVPQGARQARPAATTRCSSSRSGSRKSR